MMYWYGHDMSGWGWFAMSVGTILFWALIVTVAVLLFRALGRLPAHGHGRSPETDTPVPERILGERFARGEIDEEEYRRRLDTLRAGHRTEP